MAAANTAKSCSTAVLARQKERRVSCWTSSRGSALRKSSLNSSPLLIYASDEDVLHLEIFLEPVLRAFAAQARLLHAAEGRDLGRDDADVGADDAGLHRLGDTEDASDVAAIEVTGEPELGVVGKTDHFLLG